MLDSAARTVTESEYAMHKVFVTLISLLCACLILGYMADEAAAAAPANPTLGDRAAGVAQKTGDAVKRGATATGDAVKRGATATGNGVHRAAAATGNGLQRAADATGNGVRRGVSATGNALERAGTATRNAAGRVAPSSDKTSRPEASPSTLAFKQVGTRVSGSIPASGASTRAVARRASLRDDSAAIAPRANSIGYQQGLHDAEDPLDLRSAVALVVDRSTGETLFDKNSRAVLPIASITKMMTALVVVESKQPLDETIQITAEDIDTEKNTHSRLKVGLELTRADALHLALMASENRAASALGRHYPGGLTAFVDAMNARAQLLGMTDTHYVDSNGLSPQNRSSARDLVRLMSAAIQHPLIREYSTSGSYSLSTAKGREIEFNTTNRLVLNPNWEIGLQKTGFINEAGQCLIMQAIIDARDLWIVLLDSQGKLSRIGDAGRIRNWLESATALRQGYAAPVSARM